MVTINETPSWPDVVTKAIESSLFNVNTALPGRIETYNASEQRADIKPLINTVDAEGNSVEVPVIPSVPVKWPRTASSIISLPLAAGDTGTILFHQRSLDQWLLKGGITDPLDQRRFSLSDAEFIPGLYPFSEPGPAEDDNILIKNDLAEIRLKPTGCFELTNGTEELIGLIDEILDEVKTLADETAAITVTTVVGTSSIPVNSAMILAVSTALLAIKTRLETLKC